jgi:hypothetical protein
VLFPDTLLTGAADDPFAPQSAPHFIPDLPGYGNSQPPNSHDKLSVGLAVLSAFQSLLREDLASPREEDVPIILIGYDRGARVAHRLGVWRAFFPCNWRRTDRYRELPLHTSKFRSMGTEMIDSIQVRTTIQWVVSAEPAREHWVLPLAIPRKRPARYQNDHRWR